jgi:radical SAM superfamily enzyme YgiQ (UPF0313 family)
MKLVLIQPPIRDFYHTPIRLLPLGLAYLKAAVRKYLPGVEVVVKDFHQGWGSRTLVRPPELDYLQPYYGLPDQSPFSTFHHYRHFGASFETVAAETAREKPDLVGISSLFTPYYREALACAEAVKKVLQVPVLLGGSQVSAAPGLMLAHPAVDWIVRGEGERPLVELLKVWQDRGDLHRVPNLGFKIGREAFFNPERENFPLDELPHPDLSDLPPARYRLGKRPLCFLIASRGCPHHCSFCSVHLTFGHHYRRRSTDDLIREIDSRFQQGYRVFDFEDDNLTYDREEMLHLCRHLENAYPPGTIECLAMNGISCGSLDLELLGWMKRAHFTQLNLALVSGDPHTRARVTRPESLAQYLEVVQAAHRLGFRLVSYQILGLPGETRASQIDTLRLAARLPVLIGASPFYVIPGTAVARSLPALSEADLFRARLTALAFESAEVIRDDLYTLLVCARIINFFKGLRFHEARWSLGEALDFARGIGKRAALGVEIFNRLVREKQFYTATNEGLKIQPRFQAPLFFEIWDCLEAIVTQAGRKILLKKIK